VVDPILNTLFADRQFRKCTLGPIHFIGLDRRGQIQNGLFMGVLQKRQPLGVAALDGGLQSRTQPHDLLDHLFGFAQHEGITIVRHGHTQIGQRAADTTSPGERLYQCPNVQRRLKQGKLPEDTFDVQAMANFEQAVCDPIPITDEIRIFGHAEGRNDIATECQPGSAGPFRGELGSAWEGSIRTAGTIKWPGRINAGKTNGMISIMDFMPTLATLAGAQMPEDRPIDGVDQSAWLLGQQPHSNREHLLTFIGADLVAIRWRHFRIYTQDIVQAGNGYVRMGGTQGARVPKNGYPYVFNIEADPREEHDTGPTESWVVGKYMPFVQQYYESLRAHPNPPVPTITDFSEK